MISPGYGFVYAQILVVVIDAVQQDAFPFRLTSAQEDIGTERLQYCAGGGLESLFVLGRQIGEIEESARGDGRC